MTTSTLLRFTPQGAFYRFFLKRRKRLVAVVALFLARWAWKGARAFGSRSPWWTTWGVTTVLLWIPVGNLLAAGFVMSLVVPAVRWAWLRRSFDRTGKTPEQLRKERERIARLRRQWVVACKTRGLVGDGKQVPRLFDVKTTPEGDVTARITSGKIGVSPARVAKEAGEIASAQGCREVVVTPLSSDTARLHFYWSDPTARPLSLKDLPRSGKGETFAFGKHTTDGSPALLRYDQSILIGGTTGAGKSTHVWASLRALQLRGIPYELYVSDPKEGMELAALERALGQGELFRVVEYVDNVADTVKMLKHLDGLRRERARRMKAQGLRKAAPTRENPLRIALLDETLALTEMLNTKNVVSTPIGQIAFAGRATLDVVWACTQLGQKAELGPVRDLIPQRVSYRQSNAVNTNMILGDGMEQAGAACSKIPVSSPGVGYVFNDETGVLGRFRSPMVTDDDIGLIARGVLPQYVVDERVRTAAMPHAIYYLYGPNEHTGALELWYIGETDLPERRYKEHARDQEKADWWPRIDWSRSHEQWVSPKDAEDPRERAKEIEQEAIETMGPRFNKKHNQPRLLRLVRGKAA